MRRVLVSFLTFSSSQPLAVVTAGPSLGLARAVAHSSDADPAGWGPPRSLERAGNLKYVVD